ncbi:MAG: GAF domain/GGDEF domain protein, partial [Parcubacteria group bacterium GW2011_GWC2_45_7]
REIFFSPYETRIFEVIASHTAIAISNAGAYLQMEKMATTDGLTGLFNHRYFQNKLSKEIDRADRYKERLSLLLVDIDHFKRVNDTYGHPAGDKILKGVSKILASAVRTVDMGGGICRCACQCIRDRRLGYGRKNSQDNRG